MSRWPRRSATQWPGPFIESAETAFAEHPPPIGKPEPLPLVVLCETRACRGSKES